MSTPLCPICGGETAERDRLPARLHATAAADGLGLGLGVWVHPTCFGECPPSDQPAPVPW